MAKTYTYELGGKDREFKYGMDERDALEDRFEMGLAEIIRKKVIGENGREGIFKVQVAFIHQGIKHHGPAINEAKVRAWLTAEIDQKGHLFDALTMAAKAAFASGCLGLKHEEAEEEPSGKDAAGEATE